MSDRGYAMTGVSGAVRPVPGELLAEGLRAGAKMVEGDELNGPTIPSCGPSAGLRQVSDAGVEDTHQVAADSLQLSRENPPPQ